MRKNTINKIGSIVGIGLIALLVIGAFFFMRSSENLEVSDNVAQESEASATEEEVPSDATPSDVTESDEQDADESTDAEAPSDAAEDEQAGSTDEESSEADSAAGEAAPDVAESDEQASDESAEAVASEKESAAPVDESTDDEPVDTEPIDDEAPSGEDAIAQVAGYIDPSLTDGEELYIDNCARCHGLDGNGTGHSIGSLGNIQGSFILSLVDDQSDDELYNTITNGKGVEMPPWGLVTTEEQRRALVAHIRTLALQ